MSLKKRLEDKINKNVKTKHIVLFYGIIMQLAFFSIAFTLYELVNDFSISRLVYLFIVIFIVYLCYGVIMYCQKLKEKHGDILYYDTTILEKNKNV